MSSDKINAITLTLKEQKEHVTTARGHTDKTDFKADTIFCAAYMVLASLWAQTYYSFVRQSINFHN